MIRVLIVDDHPVVRAGLRAVLGTAEDIEVVAEAGSAADAVDTATGLALDVVLMDLRLHGADPTADGIYATQAIRELADPPNILILTTYQSDVDIVRAVDAGAVGYLLKDTAPDVLIAAIRSAAGGETVLGPAIAARLMSRVASPNTALTGRELEIVEQLADGGTNREIARRLVISEATVKSHLVHIFDKLGVNSRTKVIAAARERGLIG
ncbi:response regulator [Gordonia hydrophobica]|uniref:Response regulator transcription factor n=1 Tax=Gordonia hydrophobica TaxID=40516 RepID=A0ABZ2U265_9ACTN|nr:response regulator transcription factor [Gordonia hydrophobica]MBM7366846.1 DNA-binding NarL/FixJ family response regulator [Gordonia hydrophobica]